MKKNHELFAGLRTASPPDDLRDRVLDAARRSAEERTTVDRHEIRRPVGIHHPWVWRAAVLVLLLGHVLVSFWPKPRTELPETLAVRQMRSAEQPEAPEAVALVRVVPLGFP